MKVLSVGVGKQKYCHLVSLTLKFSYFFRKFCTLTLESVTYSAYSKESERKAQWSFPCVS